MELRKIIEGINSSWVLHVFSVDFITESSEKLLQYLLKLKFNKETEEYYLFQFPQGGYPAIRVFGHFLNAIKGDYISLPAQPQVQPKKKVITNEDLYKEMYGV